MIRASIGALVISLGIVLLPAAGNAQDRDAKIRCQIACQDDFNQCLPAADKKSPPGQPAPDQEGFYKCQAANIACLRKCPK